MGKTLLVQLEITVKLDAVKYICTCSPYPVCLFFPLHQKCLGFGLVFFFLLFLGKCALSVINMVRCFGSVLTISKCGICFLLGWRLFIFLHNNNWNQWKYQIQIELWIFLMQSSHSFCSARYHCPINLPFLVSPYSVWSNYASIWL